MPPPHQSLRFNSGKFFLAGLCYCVIKNRSGKSGAVFIKEIDVTCLNLSRQLF